MRGIAVFAVCLTAICAIVAAVVPRGDRTDEAIARAVEGLPLPARPAFEVGPPRLLDVREARARYAPVEAAVDALAGPRAEAPTVARLERTTPEGTTNIVLVLGEVSRSDGAWVHVRLPVLPNGRTAWVPRSLLGGYRFVKTHLVVSRSRLTATLYLDRKPIFRARVGIGTPEAPTPSGKFYIRNRVVAFDDSFYGPVAFGTSARSSVLTDWPGGGFVGIHGTNAPELIPGRVSHGCIRMRNDDIVRLDRLMPVGTPLTIT